MNRLSRYDRVQIVRALVEGNSIRATCRMTGVAKGTVLKLLEDIGTACWAYSDATLRGLTSRRIQCDEIWAFVHAKQKNIPAERKGEPGIGDVWTWTAIDADTKLVVAWALGDRSAVVAEEFMSDVATRLANRVQITTDGHHAYLYAVDSAFRSEVDFAQLIKLYGGTQEDQRRYSPAQFSGTEKRIILGNPDEAHVSTSFVERANLTMRMSMRRFTRLTNGFSKKVDNLFYALALHFAYCNFARPHMSLKGQTPAMAAGVADHVWTIDELVELLEARENLQKSN